MDEKYNLKRINNAKDELNKYQAISNKLSNLRLVSFILFLCSFIFYIIVNNYLYLIFAIIFLGTFAVLIFIHSKVANKINYYKLLMETLNEYVYRFDNRWMTFSETGLDYNNPDLPFLQDLDIIGDVSLFKYLNICISKNGNKS